MAKIQFNVGEGGLGRPLNGKDYYSGFLFDSTDYPTGFSADEPIKLLTSLQEAESLGITNDGIGEVVATGGAVEVTVVGAAGDIWTVTIKSQRNPAILLAQTIQGTADTIDSLASRIADTINESSNVHGFTATASLGVVNLVCAPNWGEAFNAAGLTCTTSGAGTYTLTQFTGGVGSDISIMYYHISEFFRLQPKGLLWFGIYDEAGGLNTQDIEDIAVYANGDIRQMAVYLKTDYTSSDLNAIQGQIDVLQAEY
ncbi:unnamed protein product, partial [marine sediment metagenome]